MPVIPIYRQQVVPSGVPNLGRVSPGAAAAMGQATAQLGQAGEQVVGQQLQMVERERLRIERERDELDTLRAEDAFNKLRERQMSLMMDPDKGFLSRKGSAAIGPDVVPEYTNQFSAASKEIESTLTSERQKMLFQRQANRADTEYRNSLMRHVLDQSNAYAKTVYEGTLSVEANRAMTDYANPYTIQLSMERIDQAVAREAKRNGLAADASAALLRDARSKVHSGVIAAALEAGNVGYAEQYLKRSAEQMNAFDLLKVQGAVTREVDSRVALTTAGQVMSEARQKLEPNDFNRLSALVEQQESGGRQDAVSPKGAIGVMQVMPKTGPEAAQAAGLPWDEKRFREDADYNRNLGQGYLAKMLRMFEGDPAKALAAYNAGPGTVSNAVAMATSAGTPERWRYYLSALQSPENNKQTNDYLDAILPQFNSGASAGARPTLEQLQGRVREIIGTDNPTRLKLALDETARMYREQESSMKQRQDEALGEAYRILETNGGRYEMLPASVKSRVPPDKFGTLREFGDKIAAGRKIETNWDVYYPLRTDPKLLVATNLAALKPVLSDTDFRSLAAAQAELRNKPDAAQTIVQTPNQRISMRLNEMNIDPTPKPGSKDAKAVAQVWSLFDERVRASEAALGRKLKPEEIDVEIDRLFGTVEVKGRLYGSNERRLFQLTPTDEVVNITVPPADRAQITRALRNAGQEVTEQLIQYYYRKAQGLQ